MYCHCWRYSRFVLQVDEIINIALPIESRFKPPEQYKKNKKNQPIEDTSQSKDLYLNKEGEKMLENPSEQETNKRTLKLNLTDGVQHFVAIEYAHCPQISVNTLPGTKVLTPH